MVAQESLLFTGTLRFNLDPFGQYEDHQLWDALEKCSMAAPNTSTRPTPAPTRPTSPGAEEVVEKARFIKSLDMLVTEGGKNFSAGEKQLIALARGLLKLSSGSSSILILDESTASLGTYFAYQLFAVQN